MGGALLESDRQSVGLPAYPILLVLDYLAVNGFRAVTVPSVPMQMAPLADPGSLRPSPVSDVTTAENFSAVGLVGALLTYPGQSLADVAAIVGAPIVVLPPDDHGMVPPVASARAPNGVEVPPVLPPVQPLTVRLPATFPFTLVHVRALPVHSYTNFFSAVIVPSVATHTSPVWVAGNSMPSPVSPVTWLETERALGSGGVVPFGGFT
jgi:hypothetical protein